MCLLYWTVFLAAAVVMDVIFLVSYGNSDARQCYGVSTVVSTVLRIIFLITQAVFFSLHYSVCIMYYLLSPSAFCYLLSTFYFHSLLSTLIFYFYSLLSTLTFILYFCSLLSRLDLLFLYSVLKRENLVDQYIFVSM